MASAVRWQLAQQTLSILRGITWAPEDEDVDTITAIEPDSIAFRKVSIDERPDDIGHEAEIMPGILLSCPHTDCEMNYDHGTNVLEQVSMKFLVQFLDRDSETKIGGQKTYWKWQELCFCTFSEGVAKFADFESGSLGQLVSIRITSVDSVDERYWVRHQAFVSGVILDFQVQFTRL